MPTIYAPALTVPKVQIGDYIAQAGIYTLWCLPIKIPGLDGAPARALLIQE